MKKYLAIFIAALFVVGMSAFTAKHLTKHKYTDVYFHFIPANGSEGAYESTGSWEVGSTGNDCSTGSDPCIIIISDEFLTDTDGDEAKVASLVSYLTAQNNEMGEYADAEAAVLALTDSWKP